CCHGSRVPRDLLSFPTRRSSDLEFFDQEELRAVGVLVLVDHDVAKRRAPALAYRRVIAQKADRLGDEVVEVDRGEGTQRLLVAGDRKSTRLNSSHVKISYAVFCL